MKRTVPVLWLFIIAVATRDVYLASRFESLLPSMELNPIGRWLIEKDGGRCSLLVSVKWLSNLLLMCGLVKSCDVWPKWSLRATVIAAVLQAVLLLILEM